MTGGPASLIDKMIGLVSGMKTKMGLISGTPSEPNTGSAPKPAPVILAMGETQDAAHTIDRMLQESWS